MATLHHRMNNARVGTLTRRGQRGAQFPPMMRVAAQRRARPLSLSLPLRYSNITADAVYHYFDNLLPDSPQVPRPDRQALSGALETAVRSAGRGRAG